MTEREPLVDKTKQNLLSSQISKEASIRKKLRTYEIARALQEGYLPSNDQIVSNIDWLLNAGILEPRARRLSAAGRNAVRDLRAWVEAIKALALESNSGDHFQEIFHHTAQADVSVSVDADTSSAAVSSRQIKRDTLRAREQLRTLTSLLYSNAEFRKLLSDAIVLGEDLLADTTESGAELASNAVKKATDLSSMIRPSEERLEQVDKSADEVDDKTYELPSQSDLPSKDSIQKEKNKVKQESKAASKRAAAGYSKYLKSKFPKQRQDALIARLKKLVESIQKNPEFSGSIDFLLELLQKYVAKFSEQAEKATSSADVDVETNNHFDIAFDNTKELLVGIAGGHGFEGIASGLSKIREDVQNNKSLQDWYSNVKEFFDHIVHDVGYITTDEADQEGHDLYSEGQRLLAEDKMYQEDITNVFHELRGWINSVISNRTNKHVVHTGHKVWDDFVTKKTRMNVWRDFSDVILPKAISLIRYIPVPRIEYQDADMDIVVENLVLESDNFLPHKILIESNSSAEYTNSYVFTSEYRNSTTVSIQGLSMFVRDVSFAIRKKTGWFQFQDRGLVDIFMDEDAISVKLILDTAIGEDADSDEDYTFFSVQSVKVKIRKFRYRVKRAEHSFAASLLEPFLQGSIRRLLSRMLEENIRDTFEKLDKEIRDMGIRLKAATIANNGQASPEAWLRAVFAGGGRFNRSTSANYAINIGFDEELLPGFRGPHSLTGGLKKAEVNATSGHGWRNNVFNPPT